MRHQDRVWSFETAQFRIECYFAPDDDVDTSFDDTGETVANLNSGLWTAFQTEVRVVHKATGAELGADHLGGSIYANPRDFLKEHIGLAAKSRRDGCNYGSYFPGMVREAVTEARKQVRAIGSIRLRQTP